MPVQVLWDDPETKRIMRFIYEKQWSWDEAISAVADANRQMDAVTHGNKCVSIVDMSATKFMPPNAAVYIRTIIRSSMAHNNSGITVFINADRVVSLMITTLRRVYPDLEDFSNFLYARNLVEAREMAAAQLEKLRV